MAVIHTNEVKARAPYKVLYDADCSFCQSSIELLKSLDKNHLTEAVPLSEDGIKQLNLHATFKECAEQMHVVDAQGKLYVGYDAIVALAALFPSTTLLSAFAKNFLPHSLGVRIYKLIARNRYKIMKPKCESGTCQIHYED